MNNDELMTACREQADYQNKVLVDLYNEGDGIARVLCTTGNASAMSGKVEHIVWYVSPNEHTKSGVAFDMGRYYYDLDVAQIAHLRYLLEDNPTDLVPQSELDTVNEEHDYVLMTVSKDSTAMNRLCGYQDGGIVVVTFDSYDEARECAASVTSNDPKRKYILV